MKNLLRRKSFMQKFGVREICNVVLKAKAAQKVGKKIFYKNEPVMYFDTLKTSSLEGQSSTVYAQGGRGNPRLVAWEGERTVTFTMEDALISAEGLSILTGAGLIDAKDKPVYQHITEIIDKSDLVLDDIQTGKIRIPLSNMPYLPNDEGENFAYVMFMKDGQIVTEPYIPVHGVFGTDENGNATPTATREANGNITYPTGNVPAAFTENNVTKYYITIADHANYNLASSYADMGNEHDHAYVPGSKTSDAQFVDEEGNTTYDVRDIPFENVGGVRIDFFDSILVDYYVAKEAGATQIEISADKFGGNYYLEAETLFRTESGQDMPAEFVIPNCKVQSNFNFAMSNTGDPSTFTFTMDAFPDYTRFDHTHKVFAAI
jgi:hypothetical protein